MNNNSILAASNLTRIFKSSVAVSVAVFLVAALFISPVFADQGDAQNAISLAKTTIKNCYDAVKQAESAGANVDSLMVTLNGAAGLLSKAELAYASKDYNSAYTYATQSKSKLGDFTSQATAQTANAQANATQNLMFTILSVVGSIGILCAGVVAWVVLGRRERGSINGSPEV
ncbi:MAG: hypothetical protein M1490_00235 [Candidatus Bathyarchaeota archaeon]|nr:hypothetical protein [Candidatus Bathyarchaeota archaeon]